MQSVAPVTQKEQKGSNQWGMWLGIAAAIILFVIVILHMGLIRTLFPATSPQGSFTLTTQNFQFSTNALTAKAGEPITLYLRNDDVLDHAFDLDELNLHLPMASNEIVPITFTATEPGTYTFYCGLAGHREAGMVGTLIVAPADN